MTADRISSFQETVGDEDTSARVVSADTSVPSVDTSDPSSAHGDMVQDASTSQVSPAVVFFCKGRKSTCRTFEINASKVYTQN